MTTSNIGLNTGIDRSDFVVRLLFENMRLTPPPSKERTIFVNRNLRMENIKYVGFDLDWTLAAYNRLPLEELTFKLTLDRLVTKFKYPKSILAAEFRPAFSYRGLLIDKIAGTVLKMDRHRYVGKAFHGRRQLDDSERTQLYRQKKIDLTRERFYHVDTLFELPEVNLFSELVELTNHKRLATRSFQHLFNDIRAAIDEIHADMTLKAQILADLPKYLPRDSEMTLALLRLMQGNRKLFLLTNSEWYYTDSICSHLFDGILPGLSSWRELFDLIVVSASKPRFFRKTCPFLSLAENNGDALVPEWNGIYRAGSRDGLMSLLGTSGEQVLYVGDHIYGDIRWSRFSSAWRTVLIASELENELSTRTRLLPEISRLRLLREEIQALGHHMDQLKDLLTLQNGTITMGEQASHPIMQELEEISTRHRTLRKMATELQEGVQSSFNPTWGSVFKQGGSKSLFGAQVEDLACLYTSRVSNFCLYGSHHYFRVVNDPMAHEHDLTLVEKQGERL